MTPDIQIIVDHADATIASGAARLIRVLEVLGLELEFPAFEVYRRDPENYVTFEVCMVEILRRREA